MSNQDEDQKVVVESPQPTDNTEENKNDTVTTEEVIAKNFNFQQDAEYTSNNQLDKKDVVISLPSSNLDEIEESINSITSDKENFFKNESNANWLQVIQNAITNLVFNNGLTPSLDNKDALFKQHISSPSGDLKPGTPKFKKSPTGQQYAGEAALIRIKSAIGLGTVFSIPLWHSGFWITLKAPSDSAVLELYRSLSEEKKTLGRATYGLVFGNNSVYYNKILVDFIVANIYNTSIKLTGEQNIRDYIKIQDLSVIIWGLACAIYSKGFNYQRACVVDPEECTHIVTEKLDLRKLLWVDSKSLTPQQINHMTNRAPDSMSVESVKSYTDGFSVIGVNEKIALNDTVSVVLKAPTIKEHIEAGDRWVSDIEQTYIEALTEKTTIKERNEYLNNHGKATMMRQYTHFVKSIIIDEDEYTDIDIIEGTLSEMSSEDSLRETFLEKCKYYINKNIISLVAIPTYKCPNCGNEQPTNHDKGKVFRSLIALDSTQTFFTLLLQKVIRIEKR